MSKAIADMSRDELKELNKEKGLGVKVKTSMSDEDLRKVVQEALDKNASEDGKSGPESAEDESDEVTFYTKYLGLHIGPCIFRQGEYTTDDAEMIKLIKKSSKFGVSVFVKK